MSRLEKVIKRALGELENTPGLSLRDVARKFIVSEGDILEALKSEGVHKVRRDQREQLLDELCTWGFGRLHVHNDWAESEVTCVLGDLRRVGEFLILQMADTLIRIEYSKVETVYLVEGHPRPSVQFFNKRGRCVFQVVLDPSPASFDRLRKAREAFCPAREVRTL